MKIPVLAGLFGLCVTSAIAHSPLKATIPSDGSVIAEAPEQIVLNFKGKIRLTQMALTHAEHRDVDVKLDLRGQSGFVSEYSIPMKDIGDGEYMIEWRGLGSDGHAMKGSFSFTVE